jgi:hypothetical protein
MGGGVPDDEEFASDASAVERDLLALKRLLETTPR